MNIIETPLQDVMIIEPRVFGDQRGYFMETWNEKAFADAGLSMHFVQDNQSLSVQGILRGLHYQTEHSQGKLVRVSSGEVFDVAVDLRRSSSTFGKWFGVRLSADNKRMFWIPKGFAHGFYVTSAQAEFIYKCTDFYHPESEVTLAWDDPQLNIDWPLVDGRPPTLSAKDQQGRSFADTPTFP